MDLTFDISVGTQGRTIVAIDRFDIPSETITFLFGESGIGKSILSKAAFGLLNPLELAVTVNGRPYREYLQDSDTRAIRENGFFVFQEPSTHLNPLIKLGTQLREGSLDKGYGEREILRRLWDTDRDESILRILNVYPRPHRPSGGEKQRILLAMAFKKINRFLAAGKAARPHMFVFDEPTGSLDNHFRNLFLELLAEKFRRMPFTAMLITHDYSMISEVYRRFPDLKKRIKFRELQLAGNEDLVLKSFQAQDYLRWIDASKDAARKSGKPKSPLLELAGGYEVFGRKMILSGNGSRKDYGRLTLHPGEITYVKAASGIGKTTLAKIIMGLQPCKNLELNVAGRTFTQRTPLSQWRRYIWGKKIGMVFQHADEALNLKSTVKEVFGGLPVTNGSLDDRLPDLLGELFDAPVDPAFLDKPVDHLSGGQKQRLNLLRTLVLDTDILILDEPLNGLDFQSIQRVIAMLQEKQARGKAILMISHNEDIFDAIVPGEQRYYLFGD